MNTAGYLTVAAYFNYQWPLELEFAPHGVVLDNLVTAAFIWQNQSTSRRIFLPKIDHFRQLFGILFSKVCHLLWVILQVVELPAASFRGGNNVFMNFGRRKINNLPVALTNRPFPK